MAISSDKKRITITLTTAQAERLRNVTTETGVSGSSIVSLALSAWLDEWDARKQAAGRQSLPSVDVEY